jgi:hypothetical protein
MRMVGLFFQVVFGRQDMTLRTSTCPSLHQVTSSGTSGSRRRFLFHLLTAR